MCVIVVRVARRKCFILIYKNSNNENCRFLHCYPTPLYASRRAFCGATGWFNFAGEIFFLLFFNAAQKSVFKCLQLLLSPSYERKLNNDEDERTARWLVRMSAVPNVIAARYRRWSQYECYYNIRTLPRNVFELCSTLWQLPSTDQIEYTCVGPRRPTTVYFLSFTSVFVLRQWTDGETVIAAKTVSRASIFSGTSKCDFAILSYGTIFSNAFFIKYTDAYIVAIENLLTGRKSTRWNHSKCLLVFSRKPSSFLRYTRLSIRRSWIIRRSRYKYKIIKI